MWVYCWCWTNLIILYWQYYYSTDSIITVVHGSLATLKVSWSGSTHYFCCHYLFITIPLIPFYFFSSIIFSFVYIPSLIAFFHSANKTDKGCVQHVTESRPQAAPLSSPNKDVCHRPELWAPLMPTATSSSISDTSLCFHPRQQTKRVSHVSSLHGDTTRRTRDVCETYARRTARAPERAICKNTSFLDTDHCTVLTQHLSAGALAAIIKNVSEIGLSAPQVTCTDEWCATPFCLHPSQES